MKIDFQLILAVGALAVFGTVLQARVAGEAPSLAPLVLGACAFAACACACAGDRVERLLRGRGAWIVWGLAVAVMGALLVFGRRYRGGLYLPGRINPSELVKICTVACVAAWLGAAKDLRDWMRVGAAGAVLAGAIACAGDFGLLAQLVFTGAAMLFVVSWWQGLLAFGALVGGFCLVSLHPVGHLATRFAVWRDPLADMTGAGWQTLQGLAAIVGGGVTGSGFKMGDMDAVPIAASDFVYAALAKDFGLVGCAVVLALWLLVFVRGLKAAAVRARAGETCGALFAAGLVSSLGVQTLLNVAGVLNALPMTGITLPLVSHGGSSFVVTLAMCGALLGLGFDTCPPSPAGSPRRR